LEVLLLRLAAASDGVVEPAGAAAVAVGAVAAVAAGVGAGPLGAAAGSL